MARAAPGGGAASLLRRGGPQAVPGAGASDEFAGVAG
jgi:hypothetical protein